MSVSEYIRGNAWPAGAGVPYPRANPADFDRLPIDTWGTAQIPVGVRLEVVGDAAALEIDYRTETDDLGYRGDGAGRFFTVFRNDTVADEQPAVLGSGTVRVAIDNGDRAGRAIVYLPEGMRPTVEAVRGVDGSIEPAPMQPRWLCYGDSIAEGWIASGPAYSWPAVAGRVFELDVANLGYAGSARGETVSAEHLAGAAADVISISHGTNCWTRIQHSEGQMRENMVAFLTIVRAGHPDTPIVVASPVRRPDAEETRNGVGATLADLRRAIEDATQTRIDAGDELLTLVPGADLLTDEHLPDGIHPGDAGHLIIGGVFGEAVRDALDRAS